MHVLYWRPAPHNECTIVMPNPSGDAKNMSATAQHLFAMEITVGTGSKRARAISGCYDADWIMILLGYINTRIGAHRSYAICIAAVAEPGSQLFWAAEGQSPVTSNQWHARVAFRL